MTSSHDPMAEARARLRDSSHVVFFTGAGLGAESGIPTFRGSGALWQGFQAEELASPQGFARDPVKVWEWYRWRRCTIAEAEPHAGHRAIARYQAEHPTARVVTQNVDGLHQRAGSRDVVELHGNIWRRRCQDCGFEESDESLDASVDGMHSEVPVCGCGGRLRPGVVWFGEGLPVAAWEAAERALARADLVVVVGTSNVVQPAASLVGVAVAAGAGIIDVNPEPAVGPGAISIASGAASALPTLLGPAKPA